MKPYSKVHESITLGYTEDLLRGIPEAYVEVTMICVPLQKETKKPCVRFTETGFGATEATEYTPSKLVLELIAKTVSSYHYSAMSNFAPSSGAEQLSMRKKKSSYS